MRPQILPRRGLVGLLAALVALAWTAAPALAASPPPVRGTGGAVVSDEEHATRAGLELLAAGGNAVDAAVGTALALAVALPEAGNLGGGGFAVVRMGGELSALDFREVAPAAARRDLFLGPDGAAIPEASLVGPLAAGVPGSPAGLYELHRLHGSLPWRQVVEPARRLAAEGFPVNRYLSARLAEARAKLARFPETADRWLPGGEPPPPGTILRQPELAAALTAYAERGPEAVMAGPVAAAIEERSRRHGGILTAADLAAYRPAWREPLRFAAFGWELASMPLPSSGGLILAETTGMLERLGWAKLPRFGAERAHLLAESWRRAYADRYLLGDPATTAALPADLLAPARLDARAAGIDPGRATPSAELMPGEGSPAPATGDGAEAAVSREPASTTHLSVADASGNLVALTTTLNEEFGCGLWVPEAGFFLNNEMDDFATAPGKPNIFGLVQGEANAVRPGRRMLSSMTPTLAWRGAEALAVGGRGGSRIPTHVQQVLSNLLADGDGLQAAIDRPRLHHQWLPDALRAEDDALAPEARAELARRGHTLVAGIPLTRINAVRRLPDGTVEAAGESRSQSAAGAVVPTLAPPQGGRSSMGDHVRGPDQP
jgi:gamma-glutamyltranspeptidase/glutathione hydrolase